MKSVLPPLPICQPFIILDKVPYPPTPGMNGEVAKANPTLKDFEVSRESGVGTHPAWMLRRARESWDKGFRSGTPSPVFAMSKLCQGR